MESDRVKWNQRFASEEYFLGKNASPFLQRTIEALVACVPGKRALDVACGEGRNSVFLSQNGFDVTGVDISDVGLAKGVKSAAAAGVDVHFIEADLDDYTLPGMFDLIINFNFLSRPLVALEYAALNCGGILMIDTIMASEKIIKQHNPLYLLQPGELRAVVDQFDGAILEYEECWDGDMPTARVLFQKYSQLNAK